MFSLLYESSHLFVMNRCCFFDYLFSSSDTMSLPYSLAFNNS